MQNTHALSGAVISQIFSDINPVNVWKRFRCTAEESISSSVLIFSQTTL